MYEKMPDPQELTKAVASPQKQQISQISNQELAIQISNISRRLRIVEERYNNIRKKMQVTDQNMITSHKRHDEGIRALNTDFLDTSRDMEDVKEKIKLIIRELKVCAKYDEVKVLERYINLWEPVKYVTQAEVESIARRILEEAGNGAK